MTKIRNILFTLALIVTTMCAYAGVRLGFDGERSATVGIYVKDIRTGAVVAENNSTMAMSPASVMKVLTAATVYSTVDHSYRFKTRVYLTGTVCDSVCSGDLLIVSCADPTIDSGTFEYPKTFCDEILEAVLSAGIKRIEGKVRVEESLSEPGCIPQWEVDDVPWSYGAGLYGFNYLDNTFTLWPVTKVSKPHVPDLRVKLIKGKGVDLKRGIDSDLLLVYGPRITDKKWEVRSTMNHPAAVFAYDLTSRLTDADIEVCGAEVDAPSRISLFEHHSPDLYDILRQTLIHSHNLFAEGLLRMIAPNGTRDDAIAIEKDLWADRGIPMDYLAVCDGSGLARANRLSPMVISDVLEWMANSEWADDYVSMFPKVGLEGTVRNFLKKTSLVGKLALKTGSMNAVQCYAGYKLDDEGHPTHVVVILVNGFYCQRASLRGHIEKFLLDTFK